MPLRTARLVVLSMGIVTLLGFPGGVLTGIYRMFLEHPRLIWLGNARLALQIALVATLLLINCKPTAIALGIVTLHLVTLLLLIADVKLRHPEIRASLARLDWKVAKQMFIPCGQFYLIHAYQWLVAHGPVLIIGKLMGGAAVAVFVTTRTLVNIAKQLFGSLHTVVWPEITALYASRRMDSLVTFYLLIVKIGAAAAIVAAVLLEFTGAQLYGLWAGRWLNWEPGVFRLFLLHLALQSVWYITTVVPMAINEHKRVAYLMLSIGVVAVALTVVLVPHMGLAGAAAALVMSDLGIGVLWLPRIPAKLLGLPAKTFWNQTILRGVWTLAACYLFGSLARAVLPAGLVSLMVTIGLVGGMGATMFIRTWLTDDERQWIVHRMPALAAAAKWRPFCRHSA